MRNFIKPLAASAASLMAISGTALAESHAAEVVSDDVISGQRAALASATDGAGFGPQSPRDIDAVAGTNGRAFEAAPAYTKMNLCNIHFHESAEHRGGFFRKFAGNGDGKGYGTGFQYDGELSEAELTPVDATIGGSEHGDLVPGDTIEVHYVHTSAQIEPGPTLGACLSESIMNPQLRVEAVVMVLVNDPSAADFTELAAVSLSDGFHQATNIPNNLGDPVQYGGSTTGPSYNEKGSPLQVSWSVRPEVVKVDISSVGVWLSDNIFDESYAHGVRNLVQNPSLLSQIAE